VAEASEPAWPPLGFSLQACTSILRLPSEEEPERTGHQEVPSSREEILVLVQAHPEIRCLAPDRAVSASVEVRMHDLSTIRPPGRSTWEEPWPPEFIQGGHLELHPKEPPLSEEAISKASQSVAQARPLPGPAPETPSRTVGEHETGHLALTTVEQAIAAYMQEMRATGHEPKTLQWHQTSLSALRHYLWRQFHLTDVGQLSRASLQNWVTDLPIALSARTGEMRAVNTVVAYARSATGWCSRGICQKRSFPKARCLQPSGDCPTR
jgi:hypothetical protein